MSTFASVRSHLDHLYDKQTHINETIRQAYHHHESDERLHRLKRKRLEIEEEISHLLQRMKLQAA